MKTLGAAGIQVKHAMGLKADSKEMRNLLDRTQILLNVHQTPIHHTLEEFRVLPALLRGVVVVSEHVPLPDAIPYSSKIVFASFDNLVDTVKKVSRSYKNWFDKIHSTKQDLPTTQEIISRMQIDARNQLAARIGDLQRQCSEAWRKSCGKNWTRK